jgi:hypothetical protein
MNGSSGETTPPSDSYRAPSERTWPIETTAYIRTSQRPDAALEDDESVSCYTYIYEERIVHIWESNEYNHDEQEEEEDEITRAKIIWERLKPAKDWFYCHTDGTRIGDGEHIPHHAHIIIGLRDEIDPDWWHKAMNETVTPTSDPDSVQPEYLAPARLDQPGATAQVCDGKDAHQEEDSNLWGKSASCTTIESLQSELETFKNSVPNTFRAIITFERQSVQMFFSPDHAPDDFRRKVKELWNIPRNHYYLKINGVHEGTPIQKWKDNTIVRVEIKGLLGGEPPGTMKIHMKHSNENKVYELKVRDDITFEDVIGLSQDIFESPDDLRLFQDGSQLDLADGVKEWTTSTGSKAQITISPDITFDSKDEIEKIPVMEIQFEGIPRWFRYSPDWRSKISESLVLGDKTWKLEKDNQEWEEGTFELKTISEESQPLDTETETAAPATLKFEVDDQGKVQVKITTETNLATSNEESLQGMEPEISSSEELGPIETNQIDPEPPSIKAESLSGDEPPIEKKLSTKKHLTIQLLGVDYSIECESQSDIWSELKKQTIVRGTLQITDENAKVKLFRELRDGARYRAVYKNKAVYDYIARDEHEKSKSSVFIDWNGEHKELRFSSNWDFWQGLRRMTGMDRHFDLNFEDPADIGEWIEGGTYRLLPDGRLFAPKRMHTPPTNDPPTSVTPAPVADPSREETTQPPVKFGKVDHENQEGWMTIKSDWALARFRKGEEMKEAFEFLFHPVEHKWRLQGSLEAFTSLTWSEGIFWFEEDGRKSCKRSFKELTKRNLSPFPERAQARLKSLKSLLAPVATEWQPPEVPPAALDLSNIDFGSGIPEMAEPETIDQPPEAKSQDLEIERDSGLGEGNPESENPPKAGDSERPRIPETSPQPHRPPALSTVDDDKEDRRAKGPTFILSKDGISKSFPAARRRISERKGFVKKHFGDGPFKFFDIEEKKAVDLGNCLEGRTYEVRTVKIQNPCQSADQTKVGVTFITEFGRHPNMRTSSSDSEAKQNAIMKTLNIHGAFKLLIDGREIKWSDMKDKDTITVERITDASVYIFSDKSQICPEDATELKYLHSDPISAAKIVQQLWPGRTLLRKFEWAPRHTWTTYESLWIQPHDSWHRWMKFRGKQREIAFVSEEDFFRQAENWVNGRVNIVDDDGNEVYLADTEEDQCYTLEKSADGKTISFRWDGLLMNAEYDGANARFWRNVKKLVNPREMLVLLQNARIVSPDRALSKITYQLARIRNNQILREVQFCRGDDIIDVDLNEEDAYTAITKTWGVANWTIVDGFGTPFAANNLRDGTAYVALKEGEHLPKRNPTRSYSVFTVNKVSDEVRFIVKCGNQTRHVCMYPFSRRKLNDICTSIWGPGLYKWNDEDTKELQGRVLAVQKMPMKDSVSKIVHYKIAYEDEPGKPQEIEMQSKCGIQIYEIEKILQCRLYGRDLYLDTRDSHSKIEWDGKTLKVGWRCRGGMYKDDTEERDIICKDPESMMTVKKEKAWEWLKDHEGMNIQRNHRSWDGKTVIPGDKFEALGRLRGGAGPKKYRNPNSVKNFNARMARRKKIEVIARAEREKRHAEEELEDSIRYRSTSVNYEGEEFITRAFVNEDWNKQTSRRFARWVRNFSGLERP